jgi:hypothetical protein
VSRPTDVDAAVHAAVDSLTREQHQAFTSELRDRFGDVWSIRRDVAWDIANNKLLNDPLDPIGEAWARLASRLDRAS